MKNQFENQQVGVESFGDARWALFWCADVLRRAYLPKIGAFWRESGSEGVAELAALDAAAPRRRTEQAERLYLPTEADERHALALKVEAVLARLGEHGVLLRQLAWGDFWSERALQVAQAHAEAARREGRKLRLNYRYTYRQLAALRDCDPKMVWREVRAAFEAFGPALQKSGLLWQPENAAHATGRAAPRRAVAAGEFKR